jgi:hypothetical protein
MRNGKAIGASCAIVVIVFVALITRAWQPMRWMMWKNAWDDDVSVALFGKVVDLAGHPVPDAKVALRVPRSNVAFLFGGDAPVHYDEILVTTDPEGRFSISNRRGSAIYLDAIRKEGFAWNPNAARGFYFSGGGVGKGGPYRPDKDRPEVFVIPCADEWQPPRPRRRPAPPFRGGDAETTQPS